MMGDFQTALAEFPWASVALRCDLPPEFAEIPDLPDRLHGAIGNRLRDRPPGGDAERLYTLMYGTHESGQDAVRPVVVQTDRDGNALTVRIHLAGTAANLMVTAGHALRAALAGGIRMGPDVRYRVMLDPGPPNFARHLGFAESSPPGADRLYIRIATPTSLRMGKGRSWSDGAEKGTLASLGNLPWNIESRIRRMAAAFHRPIAGPSGIPRRFSDLLDLTEDRTISENYLHYSKSHREPVEIPAVVGEMIFSGRCHAYLQLLAFARIFHAGSGTAFGLGRIEYAAS